MKTFDSNELVKLLKDSWKHGIPLVQNWTKNPFPNNAASIRNYCDTSKIHWGAPQGYPVQDAQRIERGQTVPRIAAFQEPGGKRRIMFSLSKHEDAAAFSAACAVAAANGFTLLTP